MGEDLPPEIMHHPLTGQLHRIDLREIHSKIDDENENNQEGNLENALHIPPPQDTKVLSTQRFHLIKRNEPTGTAFLKQGGIFFREAFLFRCLRDEQVVSGFCQEAIFLEKGHLFPIHGL